MGKWGHFSYHRMSRMLFRPVIESSPCSIPMKPFRIPILWNSGTVMIASKCCESTPRCPHGGDGCTSCLLPFHDPFPQIHKNPNPKNAKMVIRLEWNRVAQANRMMPLQPVQIKVGTLPLASGGGIPHFMLILRCSLKAMVLAGYSYSE